MSLTVPDNYKVSNIKENWIAQLTHDNSACVNFDGTDDKITFGDVLGLYTSFTLEAWIYPANVSGTKVIVERGHDGSASAKNMNWSMRLSNNRLQGFYEHSSGTNVAITFSSATVSANTWSHVAITRDDSDNKIRAYVNGVLITTSTAQTDPDGGGDGVVTIGIDQADANDFSGKIAHVRVWNIARSEENILGFMNASLSGAEIGLQGYWKLNEGSGSTVDDLTSNDNDGTIANATWDKTSFTEFISDIGISFTDTTIDGNFYHGVILNKGITIRDSINLAESSAKTSNISITVPNFTIKGSEFYTQIINGAYNYINKDVRIFSQPSNATAITNCIQIYSGRLIGVSLNEKGIMTMNLASKRPWDFISIPNTKSSTNNVYFPIAYGNYTPETSTDSSPQFCDNAVTIGSDYSGAIVHPIPQDKVFGGNIKFLMHPDTETDGTDSSSRGHYYERNYDIFIPMDPADDTAFSYGGGAAINVPSNLKREFKTQDYSENPDNDFDDFANLTSTSSYASTGTLTLDGLATGQNHSIAEQLYIDFKMPDGIITNINVSFDYSIDFGTLAYAGGAVFRHCYIKDITNGASSAKVTRLFNDGDVTGSVNYDVTTPGVTSIIGIEAELKHSFVNASDESNVNVGIRNLVLTIKCQADQSGEPEAFAKKLADLTQVYTGSDGLDKSYLGGSSNVQGGLAAHRDLLVRFTGYDVADADLYNWSSGLDVVSLRSGWNIRWWVLEPIELKRILQEIQKEFGFIFKWRPDGSGSYWAVKNSYSSTDVVATIKKEDIKDLTINHTPFSSLLTKMTINYNYHPAKKSYLSSISSEDSTNKIREKYNIRDKENIKEVNLKMNVDKPGNTDVGGGSSDPNHGYSDYYMNIFGDIKKIVSCEVVNPLKGYALETGDIIQFSNTAGEMPVQAFGGNWSNYYMVTNLNRGVGSVKITCREVK